MAEFRDALANYKISEESSRILRQTSLVLLLAATSSGRNTIIRQLLKTGEYHFIISDTTRNPRINDGIPEQNGVEYWFRSEEEVLNDIKNGEYLEAEIIHNQQVSGISIRELEKARDQQKIAITDIDLGGVKNVLKEKPDTVAILVLPPDFEEWQRRIRARGEMSEPEYRNRLETACKIFETALESNDLKFVINKNVEQAAEAVHQLARFGIHHPKDQERGRNLVEQLYIETKQYLEIS